LIIKYTLALAFVGALLSTSVFAMVEYETAPPASGSLGGVTLGDVMGAGGVGAPGEYRSEVLPRVTVICGPMCRGQSVVIYHPNGNDKIYVGGSGPVAVDPGINGGNDTPEQQDEKKKQCLANCATQDTVNKNNCTIANAQYAAKLSTAPMWIGVSGGAVSLLLTKNPLIAGGLAAGGGLITWAVNEQKIKEQMSFCLAVAARDNNDCIKNTCHAWFLPLALLPVRRRCEAVDETV